MGFYSEVQIVAEKFAFEKLKPIFERNFFYIKIDERDNFGTIRLDCVKWYRDFPEVQKVNDALRELRSDDFSTKEGFGFKMIILNEDDTHGEMFNLRGDEMFCDLTVRCEIDNPYLT